MYKRTDSKTTSTHQELVEPNGRGNGSRHHISVKDRERAHVIAPEETLTLQLNERQVVLVVRNIRLRMVDDPLDAIASTTAQCIRVDGDDGVGRCPVLVLEASDYPAPVVNPATADVAIGQVRQIPLVGELTRDSGGRGGHKLDGGQGQNGTGEYTDAHLGDQSTSVLHDH